MSSQEKIEDIKRNVALWKGEQETRLVRKVVLLKKISTQEQPVLSNFNNKVHIDTLATLGRLKGG